MKHIRPINEYFSNFNEGINYNASRDADLVELGHLLLSGSGASSEEADDDELVKTAKEKLKSIKPFALTGKVKEDLPKLVKYLTDEFKRFGIELDGDSTEVSREMSGGENMIEIPLLDFEGYYFLTSLDYLDLASNQGPNNTMVLSGIFCSEEDGMLEFDVADISNSGEIMKACTEFKNYLENTQK